MQTNQTKSSFDSDDTSDDMNTSGQQKTNQDIGAGSSDNRGDAGSNSAS